MCFAAWRNRRAAALIPPGRRVSFARQSRRTSLSTSWRVARRIWQRRRGARAQVTTTGWLAGLASVATGNCFVDAERSSGANPGLRASSTAVTHDLATTGSMRARAQSRAAQTTLFSAPLPLGQRTGKGVAILPQLPAIAKNRPRSARIRYAPEQIWIAAFTAAGCDGAHQAEF